MGTTLGTRKAQRGLARGTTCAVVLIAMAAACGGESSKLTLGTKMKDGSTVTTGAAGATVTTQAAGATGAGASTDPGGSTETGGPTDLHGRTDGGGSTGADGSDGGGSDGGGSGADGVTTTKAVKKKVKVAYPTAGPSDPMFPGTEDAFGFLKNHECAELKARAATWADPNGASGNAFLESNGSAIDLYAGAAAACLSDWPTAEAELAKVEQVAVNKSCDRKLVSAYLRGMIEAHAADPSTTPDTSGAGATCPEPTNP